jgi:hypothetical protein
MAELVVKGTLLSISEPQKKSDKFTLVEIVVEEYSPQYPQKIIFQVGQKQLEHVSKWKVGSQVEVKANVKGREYNGRYFNTIEAWFVKMEQGVSSNAMASARPQENTFIAQDDSQPLPF